MGIEKSGLIKAIMNITNGQKGPTLELVAHIGSNPDRFIDKSIEENEQELKKYLEQIRMGKISPSTQEIEALNRLKNTFCALPSRRG